jgi:CotS family spore coat protein
VNDRNDEVFEQYDIKIYNTYRARGSFILETNCGIKLYKTFEGSRNRIEFENKIKEHIYLQGYTNIDLYMRNKSGELITEDSQGNKYILKNWFLGEESNLRNSGDILLATSNLAILHNLMSNVSLTPEEKKYNRFYYLPDLYEKHNRELKRVRAYIREKTQKNEFETCYLSCYQEFYEQGLQAIELLQASNFEQILEASTNSTHICHGNYTYHNILLLKNGVATTNFDKVCLGVQILDLYLFIRKVMEKNDWNLEYGEAIIREYQKNKKLTEEDFKMLYILLLYPEKFWKITNFYFNGKKSWIPQKNIQKLVSIQQQNAVKMKFLDWLNEKFL